MGCGMIRDALTKLGFQDFKDYLCARNGWTLVKMAEELGVSSVLFIAYHKSWVDKNFCMREGADHENR